jgi:peptidyl-prolyl cis-trans isomerase SurA|tara:strand:- start:212 stop:1138 length:927 start_codon:yes stop_codon:yes gene_type:complete
MINNKKKYIICTLLFLLISMSLVFAKINSKILYKISDEIITNIDLENERKFLIFLNPNLNNLSNEQLNKISLSSLQNRKIKEIELRKYFDLNQDNIGSKFIDNFISNASYDSKKTFKIKLNEINLEYVFFEKNFIIDKLWKEYIYDRFKSQIKIDTDKLKKQIENQENEIEELNLSEILFEIKPNTTFEKLSNQIYSEIDKSGFEAAASIFSIADSKNFGGKLGWIKSSQISKKIYSQIKIQKKITNPIKTNDGFLILKINERRTIKEEINLEQELKKLISLETEKELNKIGYIYFNKIKKRIFISEN